MKKLVLLTFLIILAVGCYFCFGLLYRRGGNQEQFVLLKPGTSARHIAQQLQSARVIPSWPAFLAYHYWKLKPLKAGEYRFDHPANALEVYERLARGDVYAHTIVIPEGYNIFEIGTALQSAGIGSQQEFLQIAKSPTLIADLDPQARSLEGYLFPDTYQFSRAQSLQEIAAAMVHRFRQEAQKIGLAGDVHKIVTMASVVEKETAAAEERPMIASVYYNRLQQHMALDADPTVIYAALLDGRYRGTIFQSDLANRSPYNTYKFPGLPPGPIANPGEASLLAAMHPAETNYLYFVSDNNGHHRFAATEAEHEHNVAMYRRAVAAH